MDGNELFDEDIAAEFKSKNIMQGTCFGSGTEKSSGA